MWPRLVVLLAACAWTTASEPCCPRVSAYHLLAVTQGVAQRFGALESRSRDLHRVFSVFQDVHGRMSARMRQQEIQATELYSLVLRLDSRLQVLATEREMLERRVRALEGGLWRRFRRDADPENFTGETEGADADHSTATALPDPENSTKETGEMDAGNSTKIPVTKNNAGALIDNATETASGATQNTAQSELTTDVRRPENATATPADEETESAETEPNTLMIIPQPENSDGVTEGSEIYTSTQIERVPNFLEAENRTEETESNVLDYDESETNVRSKVEDSVLGAGEISRTNETGRDIIAVANTTEVKHEIGNKTVVNMEIHNSANYTQQFSEYETILFNLMEMDGGVGNHTLEVKIEASGNETVEAGGQEGGMDGEPVVSPPGCCQGSNQTAEEFDVDANLRRLEQLIERLSRSQSGAAERPDAACAPLVQERLVLEEALGLAVDLLARTAEACQHWVEMATKTVEDLDSAVPSTESSLG